MDFDLLVVISYQPSIAHDELQGKYKEGQQLLYHHLHNKSDIG